MSSSPTPINPNAGFEASPIGNSILDKFPIYYITNSRRLFSCYPCIHSLNWEDETSWQEHKISQEIIDKLDIIRLADLRASLA
jgi:hypothetical protein